jgi:hypothetical protein
MNSSNVLELKIKRELPAGWVDCLKQGIIGELTNSWMAHRIIMNKEEEILKPKHPIEYTKGKQLAYIQGFPDSIAYRNHGDSDRLTYVKPGKFAKKFWTAIGYNVSDVMIEKFANLYMAEHRTNPVIISDFGDLERLSYAYQAWPDSYSITSSCMNNKCIVGLKKNPEFKTDLDRLPKCLSDLTHSEKSRKEWKVVLSGLSDGTLKARALLRKLYCYNAKDSKDVIELGYFLERPYYCTIADIFTLGNYVKKVLGDELVATRREYIVGSGGGPDLYSNKIPEGYIPFLKHYHNRKGHVATFQDTFRYYSKKQNRLYTEEWNITHPNLRSFEICGQNVYWSRVCCHCEKEIKSNLEIYNNKQFCSKECAIKEGVLIRCEECETVMTKIPTTWQTKEGLGISAYLCGNHCKEKRGLRICPNCNHHSLEELYKEDNYAGKECCHSCIEDIMDTYNICNRCEEAVHVDNTYYTHDGGYYCSDHCCQESGYRWCCDCNEYMPEDVGGIFDDVWYCESCAEDVAKYYISCENCDEEIHIDNALNVDLDDPRYFCGPMCASEAGYEECSQCDSFIKIEKDGTEISYKTDSEKYYFCSEECKEKHMK